MIQTIKIIQDLLVKNGKFNKDKAEYVHGYKSAMADVLEAVLNDIKLSTIKEV